MNMAHELEFGLLVIAEQSAQYDLVADIKSYALLLSTLIAFITLNSSLQKLASKEDLEAGLAKNALAAKEDLKSFESILHLVGHAVVLTADELSQQRVLKEKAEDENRKQKSQIIDNLRKGLTKRSTNST